MTLFEFLEGKKRTREAAEGMFPDVYQGQVYGGIQTAYDQDGTRRDFHAMPKEQYSIDQLNAAMDAKASRSAVKEQVFDYVLKQTGDLVYATQAANVAEFFPITGTAIGGQEGAIAAQEVIPYLQEGDYKSAAIEGLNAALGLGDVALTSFPVVGAGWKAARNIAPNLTADAVGVSRGILTGDADMLREVFQRSGTPQSVGAAKVSSLLNNSYVRDGEEIADYLEGITSAKEVVTGESEPPMSKITGVGSKQPVALRQHKSAGLLTGETVAPTARSIDFLEGRDVHAIVGDQSGRHDILSVQDYAFDEPVRSMAGFEYIDIPNQGYAGALSATTSKFNEAKDSVDPYYMSLLMGEKSSDFSMHEGVVFGNMVKKAAFDKKDIPFIDDKIRNIGMPKTFKLTDKDGNVVYNKNGDPKTKTITTYPFKDFKSVSDPDAILNYIQELPSGTHRSYFLKGLDKAKLQQRGMPNVHDARLAVADWNQLGMDWGTVGYRGFTPDLDKGVISTTPDMSTTYQAGVDKVGGSDTFLENSRGIPANLLFSDLSEAKRAKGTGGGLMMNSADYKSFESSPKVARQRIRPINIDTVNSFMEIEKRFGREASLKFAQKVLSEGKVTAKLIEQARKLNAPTWLIAAMIPMVGMHKGDQHEHHNVH